MCNMKVLTPSDTSTEIHQICGFVDCFSLFKLTVFVLFLAHVLQSRELVFNYRGEMFSAK